ncbi:altered inheritance of mitochondria protein 3-like [Diachasma alloeum]|uniref:altered inheritance of mitochondria protein 3-like n=1 Tax=Diachasma alloeum TaxID=454923 RepID=UPI00073825AD|nr:altered inheritance of mitochondria protein 3-like [Diachasma alloeum]
MNRKSVHGKSNKPTSSSMMPPTPPPSPIPSLSPIPSYSSNLQYCNFSDQSMATPWGTHDIASSVIPHIPSHGSQSLSGHHPLYSSQFQQLNMPSPPSEIYTHQYNQSPLVHQRAVRIPQTFVTGQNAYVYQAHVPQSVQYPQASQGRLQGCLQPPQQFYPRPQQPQETPIFVHAPVPPQQNIYIQQPTQQIIPQYQPFQDAAQRNPQASPQVLLTGQQYMTTQRYPEIIQQQPSQTNFQYYAP